MKRKKLLVLCVSLLMLGGLYVSFQQELMAAETLEDQGVKFTCVNADIGGLRGYSCAVEVTLSSTYSTGNQKAYAQSNIFDSSFPGGKIIEVSSITILPEQGNTPNKQELTDSEWKELTEIASIKSTNVFDASAVKLSSGILPTDSFKFSKEIRELHLPSLTTIKADSIFEKGSLRKLVLPSELTTVAEESFQGIYSPSNYTGSYPKGSTELIINSDFASFYNELATLGESNGLHDSIKLTINYDALQNTSSVPYLQKYRGNEVSVIGDSIHNETLDIDKLYGTNESGKKILKILNIEGGVKFSGFKLTNAIDFTSNVYQDTMTTFIVKNTSISTLPQTIQNETPTFVDLDLSGNRIDFSNPTHTAFYNQYATLHSLDEQRPVFMMKKKPNILATVGDAIPVKELKDISFVYADGSDVDLGNKVHSWIQESHFKNYKSFITHIAFESYNINMNSAGDKSANYWFSDGNFHSGDIGKNIIVVSSGTKEKPTITKEDTIPSNPTSADELVFKATLTKIGSDDINADATVRLFDEDTLLMELPLINGEAEFKIKLNKGNHKISVQYSGNANYNSVNSSITSIGVTEAENSGLIAQTLSFENDTVNMTFGDSVASNPLTQSDPHGTGTITYESSDETVATVDSTGIVTVLKEGTTTIKATIAADTTYDSANASYNLTITTPSGGSGLTAQTLSFENNTVNMTFGDSVASNPLTQSDPHGTGTITYESSDESVATVDSTGVVTVLKAGSTTIKATIAADTTYDSANASYNLTITAPSGGSELTAQTLSFENDTVNMSFGDTVASNPLTQSDPHGTGTITYESSDTSVATVDSTGTVTVLKAGTTTITATIAADTTYDSASASYSLTVNALGGLTSQSIEFEDKSVSIIYGDTVVNPLTQSDPHGTGAITYKSSDESVATIDSTGAVTILKVGTTTITAQIATDAIYASATDTYELTIAKKQASITGLLAKDKVYDGKMKVTFDTENAKVGGILASDAESLKFMLGSGAYQDSKVGVDKPITLSDFILQGKNAGNYELVLPTITGTITKAELVVNVNDVEKKEGNENPAFTYSITGFVNNETESTLSGYTKAIIESSANKTSPAGSYAITAKNASSDNYTFTYKNGTLTVKAEVAANDKSYIIEGVIGKNGWYTSKVKIKPSGNFTKIYNGKTWVNELIYEEGTHKNIKFKLKQADETESNELTIAEVKVDTTPPSVQNIKNGDTYFINRAFQAQDNQTVKVRINGKEVSETQLQVIADTSQSYAIELEDEAGNITSLKVDTQSLGDTIKPIENLTTENVEVKDKSTIENLLLKVNDLLNDTAYSPTSDQKKQLEDTKAKCETLLKQLNTADVGSEDVSGKDSTSNGVNTGDTSDIVYYGGFCLLAIGVIVSIKRRTQIGN